MIELAESFMDSGMDKERLGVLGERLFVKLYGGKEKDDLKSLR